MTPNEPAPLDPETQAVIENTETVADEILGEVKTCQERIQAISEGLTSLRENGANREQITEVSTQLTEARRELSELLQTLNNLRVETQSLGERMTALEESRGQSSTLPDSQQSTPSEHPNQTPPVVNPDDADASPAPAARRRKVIR